MSLLSLLNIKPEIPDKIGASLAEQYPKISASLVAKNSAKATKNKKDNTLTGKLKTLYGVITTPPEGL